MPAAAFRETGDAKPEPPAGTFRASETLPPKFSAGCGVACASTAVTVTLKGSPARTFETELATRVLAVTSKPLVSGRRPAPVAVTE